MGENTHTASLALVIIIIFSLLMLFVLAFSFCYNWTNKYITYTPKQRTNKHKMKKRRITVFISPANYDRSNEGTEVSSEKEVEVECSSSWIDGIIGDDDLKTRERA